VKADVPTAPAITAPAITPPAITPPAMLGILGGGQLGRYFVVAARTMGYRTMVLEPDPLAPAGRVADVHLVAPYDDPAALERLAAECAVVTTEFENPPADALRQLSLSTLVRPSAAAIATTQDRRTEKQFLRSIGIPVGPFAIIETAEHLATHAVSFPAILKTARLGYDGKGQVVVADQAELDAAWRRLEGVPCVLEQKLELRGEISVVLARSPSGEIVQYPAVRNTHVDGILDLTVVPAAGATDVAAATAAAIAEALDYVGVLAVELFEVGDELLVNELAPRPHNSGHWTLDGAETSQFEQQVRAVCGLTLGGSEPIRPGVAMVNLLGQLWARGEPDWQAATSTPGAHLHLYGKTEARPGRKMGHLTVHAESPEAAAAAALACRRHACGNLHLDH
jgi:5-(carboxyamino)imidazole ribonucleotide synthase